jgi:galactonate dehydratase
MRIRSVDVLLIKTTIPVKTGKSWPWNPIIVKINTDEGLYGLGEVGMAYGVGATAAWGMVKDLAKLIIGMDPMNSEIIWDKLMKKTFWGQGGGTVVFGGMSGIDMALWDLKGKALNVPVYKLLGGKCRNELRCYASQIQLGWTAASREVLREPSEYAEAALKAVAEGYDAVKVDPLTFDLKSSGNLANNYTGILTNDLCKMVVDRITAIREAVGNDVDIIIENHASTDTTSAIQLGRLLEPFNIMFYEEVNTPLNPELTKYVKDKINIPLAAGERMYSRWGYLPFFKDRSLDVIQPDLGTCGGLTEGKKICDMAHVYEITAQAHVCGSPIAKAAALHLETAIPNFCIHEHHRNSLIAENIELGIYDYQPVNGKYIVPELPGLGQDLSPKAYTLATKVVVE